MLAWDLQNVPLLRPLLAELPDLPHAAFIAGFIDWFETGVTPRLAAVRQQFIHNDFNDGNVLADLADESVVAGIIDFGDCVHTVLVADLAIAAVAQIADLDTAEQAVGDIARAYHEVVPLLPAEQAVLGPLIAARIVTGILIPSWHRARNPAAGHYATFDELHIRRRVALATRLKDLSLQFG
jgi:Ser/Thr protein kinase RdoA (MazF antagonist)